MPQVNIRISLRHRAGLAAVVLLTASGLAGMPASAFAGAPSTSPTPQAAPNYTAACGPVPAPFARCAALRRTDIAATPAVQPGASPGGLVVPAFVPNGYGPADLRSAYSLPASGGSGRTVAIVDAFDLPTAAADLATYRTQFGLPPCTVASGCFRKVDQFGGSSYPASAVPSGWDQEIDLDLDMVSAVCPNCKILLVEASSADLNDLGTAVDTAVALGAVVVTNSYGANEWSGEGLLDQQYNHPGVVITASTGDFGYADGVEYPAASPYVIAVGGTSLSLAGNARGWTETVWSDAGSGCSLYEPKPYWQTDSGCAHKTTADISAVANPNTGVAVFNRGNWTEFGGTSVASPIIASSYALTGQPATGSYPARLLYSRSTNLWDVTSGTNGSCGTYLCQGAVGYDGPTGLGTPNGTSALAPDVIDLGAGSRTSCALTSNGTISCWGYNGAGEANAPAGSYVALSTGDSHSCAIDTARALHCWGSDSHGESSPPAGSYLTVSAGGADSCAIDIAGAIHCWGDPSNGVTSTPTGVYMSVAVGSFHACAIDTTSAVTCWGDNSHGQGNAPAGSFVAVAAGQYHTCAITSLGAINCWGDNTFGQLNHPTNKFIDLDAAPNGACALQLSGQVACWGDNSSGQNSPPGALAARVALGTTQGCAYQAVAIACWAGNADGQSTPLFATTTLPVAGSGFPYATDVTLASAVVPAPAFSVTSGSLPAGFTLSSTGHLSGSSSTPGTYPFSVTASNGIAPSATQPLSLVVDATPVPGVPTSVTAVASDTTAVVTWAAPVPNGGSPITSYRVTSAPPTTTCVITIPAPPTAPPPLTCSFGGLTNRTPYTFSVTATNGSGTGPAASASATPLFGATYVAVTPNRLVDSRRGTRLGLKASLSSGTPVEFVVVNRSANPSLNIPATAIAVTGNLTVANQGAPGYLALTPDNPGGVPATSTLNFPKRDDRANSVTISLSGTGTLWVTYVGTAGTAADVIFDVTGYFLANSSGSTYVSLTPTRLVDSRSGTRLGLTASLRSGTPAWFTVVDRNAGDPTLNVPANATAVTGNLTITNQHSAGYLALTPTKPSGTPTTSTVNFPVGDDRANAVTISLGGGKLWVTFIGAAGSTADVVFDVTGYFVGDAGGATYVALTPNRLVDSRVPIGLGSAASSGASVEFTAVDRSADPNLNVPSGAVAITGNLTVTGQTSAGYLTLTPSAPVGTPTTSTLNFPRGDDRANGVTVATSPTGTLWVTFIGGGGARTNVVFDVTGYFAQ
jgi:hypothetical protein